MPRIFLWSVANSAETHLCWELTVSQGYKHYQDKSVVPAFPFGYVSFGWSFHWLLMASQTWLVLHDFPVFGFNSVRTKHK